MSNDINDSKYEKLKDQFTAPTRNVRRNLLAAASLSVVLVLVDAKIDALFGIKFDKNVPMFIPIGALYLVLLYEFVTFIIYGVIDFKSWYLKPHEKTYQFTEGKLQQLTTNLDSLNTSLNRTDPSFISLEVRMGGLVPFQVDSVQLEHVMGMDISEKHQILQNKVDEMVGSYQKLFDNLIETEVENFKKNISEKLKEADENIKMEVASVRELVDSVNTEVTFFEKGIKKYRQGVKGLNFTQYIRIYAIDWGVPILLGGLSLYLNFNSVMLFIEEIWLKLVGIK